MRERTKEERINYTIKKEKCVYPDRENWVLQQQNAIRNVLDLSEYFPNIAPEFWEQMHELIKSNGLKFQITPYILSQFPRDLLLEELKNSTRFKQFFPPGEIYTSWWHDAYKIKDNREKLEEFPTSLLHHKYTNRALLRFRQCLGYCNFCFEAEWTLEEHPAKHKIVKLNEEEWQKSLKYIRDHPEIEEIIFSWWEPLLLSNEKLEKYFKDIDTILKDPFGEKRIRFKRIHTRALTINPFRIDDEFVRILKEYKINDITFDVAHPDEITPEFIHAVEKIRFWAWPILAAHTPLLRGINVSESLQESVDTLWELFSRLYENNIKPYYLLHSMPHTPFADKQRVSVNDGIQIMKKLKRHKSNIALPEYIIPHDSGKITVPPERQVNAYFNHREDDKGNPIIKFVNRKGKRVEYPDIKDVITKA